MDCTGARGVKEGGVGMGAEIVRGPRGRWRAWLGRVAFTVKETMGEETQTTKGVDGKGEELDFVCIESIHNRTCCVRAVISTKFGLCSFIVPVSSGNRCRGDTLGDSRGFGEGDIEGQVGRGWGVGAPEVAWGEGHTDVGRAVVAGVNKVLGFKFHGGVGWGEASERGKAAENMV